MTLLYALFAVLIVPTTDQPEQVLLIMAILSPLLLMGLYLMWRHWGELVLYDDRLERHRGQRVKSVELAKVVAVRERDNHLPPNFVLRTPDGDFAFSRYVDRLPVLVELLRRRIPALSPQVVFPFELSFRKGYGAGNWSALALMTLIFAGGVWFGAAKSGELGATLFVAVSLWLMLIGAWYFAEYQPKIPSRLKFDRDSIEAEWPNGRRERFAVHKLQGIDIRTRKVWVKIHHGRAVQAVEYPLTLRFSDGRRIELTEARIKSFGYAPETLQAILGRLYGR